MTPEQFAKDALEHEHILDAIEAGDGDTAERLTREHITHARGRARGAGGRGRPRALGRRLSSPG